MLRRDRVINKYFEWLMNTVCGERFAREISYKKLLTYLHNTEFTYSIRKDKNRAGDGLSLRYRFSLEQDGFDDAERYLDGPCSVLEMMVALAIRCEETIMDNPNLGNRTGQWFWEMVKNLGLKSMTDSNFDKRLVEENVNRFLDREYEPNGKGGLFMISNCKHDLRNYEIWYQLCWYLDRIT